MKIGFLTNSLVWAGVKELDKIAEWAVSNGFQDLEVGPNIPLKEEIFYNVIEKYKIDISAFIYCRNFLTENKSLAEEYRQSLIERIKFAPKVGVQKIICSTGVSNKSLIEGNYVKFDPEESLEEVAETFKEFIELAEKHDVKLCFENCPVMGNTAISPYMWDRLFEKLDSDKIGLVMDPSHLIWQFINPYESILKYGHKIYHVHGKDCEVKYDVLGTHGILHSVSKANSGNGEGENALAKTWWRYRLPGLGDINWNKIIANLQEVGYDGAISIEHEDPVWEGSLEKVQVGLLKAKKHIESFL
ncbi:sugar phosphate isomerase/epimerase [Neobacillus cucumis]|uniref:sugar phosphate isomerase/epimerase family protein n=1 Tax=Neobacillus cucumis TaxID=1740721 RepID=UPI002E1D5698|nr:sugar phosphate isomerase/epimerase [Neobacillus cucumis]